MNNKALVTVAVFLAVMASTAACGSSGATGGSSTDTLNVSSEQISQGGVTATLGNAHVATDDTTHLATIAFEVTVVNSTDPTTDAFDVSVNVEKADGTPTGFGTIVISDLIGSGQTSVGHGTILFPGPFPPHPKLVITKMVAESDTIPG